MADTIAATDPPGSLPSNQVRFVNEAQTHAELVAVRGCMERDSPYGNGTLQQGTTAKLSLESALATAACAKE